MKKYLIIALFAATAGIGYSVFVYGPRVVQQEARIYHIGVLMRGSGYDVALEGYKSRMKELGYEEGKNLVYDIKYVSTPEEIRLAVREFVAKNVDLIHVYSTPATKVAYEETKNLARPIPVVFGSMGDPLIAGVIKDIQRPGTNVTGVASLSTELTIKRLELLRQINPRIKKVAMPHTAQEAGDAAAIKSVQLAQKRANEIGVELTLYSIRTKAENETVAKRITRSNTEGIIVGGDSLIWGSIDLYIAQAKSEKIPFAVFDLSQVEKGGLIGFGPDYRLVGEQSADITHQILRGSDPAEISIEVPKKLLLMLNMDTARQIGVTFSPELLKAADVIIGEK